MDYDIQEGIYPLIENCCGEKLEAEDYGFDKTQCSLIDEYDPTLLICCSQNCPLVKNIINVLKKLEVLD